jgi:WD40 repeat protein
MHLNQQGRFFLAGYLGFIYDFDIERLRVLRQLSISDEQSDCIIIKSTQPSANTSISVMPPPPARNSLICTGSTNGVLILRDSSSLKPINKFHPHSGSLSDFDIHGNYLVSCGFSTTRNGNLSIDRFLMSYDLRMMRALNPVQLLIEPCFLHYLPMCSSVVAVASQVNNTS